MFTNELSLHRVLGFLAISSVAWSHHSFMAEFDQTKPVAIEGVVTKVEWVNPHTYFYVDAKDASGKTLNWKLETGNPASLIARGWKRESLKAGDHISVEGYRAKEGGNIAAARLVTFPDGRKVFAGQTDDGGPPK
jgi:hypothetical protein